MGRESGDGCPPFLRFEQAGQTVATFALIGYDALDRTREDSLRYA